MDIIGIKTDVSRGYGRRPQQVQLERGRRQGLDKAGRVC